MILKKAHYYRFSYTSSSGGDDLKYQATAKICGSVIVDLVIKTETLLDDPRPLNEWVKSQPDCVQFSSWDEYEPELVQRFRDSLERRAIASQPITETET